MANAIELSFVNGLAGDPAVNIYFKQSGESLLFDAGHLESLSSRDILKIKVIAISHTHIDHFVGFDKIIRTNVPHFRTPEVVGPEGIIKNIQGKLAAYTWNLLDPDQVNFIVHEVKHDGSVTSVRLSNSNDFQAEILPISSPHARGKDSVVSIPLSHAPYMLSAVYVDHGMPVLAYRLQLPTALVVNKQELEASGLTPGPWISELQSRASRDDLTGVIAVDGINMSAKDLSATLLSPRQGDSVIYVTDMVFSEKNLTQLKKLSPDPTDILVCEANYRHEHRQRAHDKYHLTTRQAALIAAHLQVRTLEIFHISNVYGGDVETSLSESQKALDQFRQLDAKSLWTKASEEFPGYVNKS